MSDEKTVRKRGQRVQLACIPCRQGKLKCDRTHPVCDQCFKRARESECVFTERGLRYNTAKRNANAMRDKLDRLEVFVNRIKQQQQTPDASALLPAANERPSSQHDESAVLSSIGNLRLSESGATQFIGPTHWESIIDDIADVKEYFDLETSPESAADADASHWRLEGNVSPADVHFRMARTYTKQDIIALLPVKEIVDQLVMAWFSAPDTIRFIVHAPTFLKEYQAFWQHPDSVSPAWLSMLLAVAGLGAEVTGQNQQQQASRMIAEELRNLTTHAIILYDYGHPARYTIEALLLHVKSIMLSQHESTPNILLLLGLVTRLLTQCGYHRDPGAVAGITRFDAEMRRRLWALACEYDIHLCYSLGVVSVINQHQATTKPPSNLSDADLALDPIPAGRPLSEITPLTFEIFYSQITIVWGDIIYLSHTDANPSYHEVEVFAARLDQIRNSLPPELQMTTPALYLLDPPEQLLNRGRMEIGYQKALCVLYRRYMRDPNHEAEHQKCIVAAERLLDTIIVLLEATRPGRQLTACRIFVHRHVADSNLAAMLLCSELKCRANRAEESALDEFSRRVGDTILRVCALWQELWPPSPKQRSAITAIRKFVEQSVPTPSHHQTSRQQVRGDVHDWADAQGVQGLGPDFQDTTVYGEALQPVVPETGGDLEAFLSLFDTESFGTSGLTSTDWSGVGDMSNGPGPVDLGPMAEHLNHDYDYSQTQWP